MIVNLSRRLELDQEKWEPVFRFDQATTKEPGI
jgi:hypothetical protein